jgi:hypothetical protein
LKPMRIHNTDYEFTLIRNTFHADSSLFFCS